MIESNMLRDKIKERGIPISFIAKKIGITREGLYKKITKKYEFKASEIIIITEVLRLSAKEREAIFFNNLSEFNSSKPK